MKKSTFFGLALALIFMPIGVYIQLEEPMLRLTEGNTKNATFSASTASEISALSFDFPQDSCGDESTDSEQNWYPVFTDRANLDEIRKKYCRNAIAVFQESSENKTIKVAQFKHYKRALYFAQLIGGKVGNLTHLPERKIKNLSQESPVIINGMGPISIGMTVDEASQALGMPLVSLSGGKIDFKGCSYVKPKSGPTGVSFMLTYGQIVRIDIVANSLITTLSGVGIGDTEETIKSIYPGKIEVNPNQLDPKSHYLTFVPKDISDSNYRIVFETDANGIVTQFRAGKLPEVEYVEKCR